MARTKFPKKTNGEVTTSETKAIVPAPSETTLSPSEQPAQLKSIRKPATLKSETRATVVPINLDEEIRRVAYLLSERRGFEPGHETEDWLAAEDEVRQRYRQQSA